MQRFASLAVLAAICACTLPTTHAKRNSATEKSWRNSEGSLDKLSPLKKRRNRRKLKKLGNAGNVTKGKYCVSGLPGDFNFQSCGSFCDEKKSENHCKCAAAPS